MIFRGFKFGMMLQLAIGPVCIFIFQMASLRGFYIAASGVIGVLIVDGLYILAAILGIASIIERENTKMFLKVFGAIVLFIFGISTILSVFNIVVLPSLSLQNTTNLNNVFFRTIILTISNPLTIIFWAGVFSTKLAEENMVKKDIYTFGLGALLSTAFFLTLIALAGSLTRTFFPPYIIQFLNVLVGILLMYFSIKILFKKV